MAVRRGTLTRQPCEVCGSVSVEAHHDDYSRPLSVRWLCRPHHRAHHAAERAAVRTDGDTMSTANITPIRSELAPHLAVEASKDAAREAHWRANADVMDRPALRSGRDHIAAAEASLARQKAFTASPQGRFYSAVVNIGKAGGYVAEASRALGAYHRGFSNPNRPACAAEIGCALAALNDVPGPDGREARQALAEILMQPLSEAA